MRLQGRLKFFKLTFAVQMDNLQEMELIVDWAEQLNGIDKVLFQRLYPTGSMNDKEFAEFSCFDGTGKPKAEAKKFFLKDFMKKPIVDSSQLEWG